MDHLLEQRLLKKSRASKIPIKATLELSPLCNMHCKMCYVLEQKKDLDLPVRDARYWISLIPSLKEMGTLFVTLIGGEPFLYPDIEILYKELICNGFFVSITTNGTLLAEGLPEWLKENKPKYMTVSFYGASDEIYEKVTGNPNGYTQAQRGLRNIIDAGIPVQINYCTLPENLDDLEHILLMGKEYGCPVIASHYCYPDNARHEKMQCSRLTPEQSAMAYWKIQEINNPEGYERNIEFISKGEFKKNNPELNRKFSCNAGASQMWINWKGNLSGCGIIPGDGEPITNENLRNAWYQLTEQIKEIELSEECAVCDKREICFVCPAKMYTETGSYLGKPEYVCDIVNEIINIAKNNK